MTDLKKNSKTNLAVLFGGRSVEHEISIISALQMIKALDDSKYNLIPVYIAPDGKWFTGMRLLDKSIYPKFASYRDQLEEVILLPQPRLPGLKKLSGWRSEFIPVDVYFPVFHGENGEDGNLQGVFEMAEVPYTGFGVLSSALCMNKHICKMVLRSAGVPVLNGECIWKFEFINDPAGTVDKILANPDLSNFPIFVKPCNRGSSVGIAKAEDRDALLKALLNVFRYDLQAVIEPFMGQMFEINIAVCGSQHTVKTSVVEIPKSDAGFLSYEDKYMRSGSKKNPDSQGMASLTRVINPQDLASEIVERVQEYAKKAFQALGCSGNVRIDFMHDNNTGNVYLNELNALPGSLAFYLWAESSPELLYTDLIDELIQIAIKQAQQKASLDRFIGFKALK